MDRKLVFAGAIPQETDVLAPQRYAVEGLGWLAFSIFGSTTTVEGMTVVPSSPTALTVQVNPGAIYAPLALDANSFSSLAADSHTIMQQGILRDVAPLTITPPPVVGQSRVYVVQAACQVVDADPATLPYYNAADPTTALNGPGGAGTPQNTRRSVQAVVSLKVGTSAPTGSQTAPAPDAGYVELARVTVANGATAITSGNIVQNAALRRPFSTLPDMLAAIRAVTPVMANSVPITGSGTYTPPAKLIYALVEGVGGGGGGGAASGGSSGSAGAGGGGGGYGRLYLTRDQIGAGLSITVGAGGAGGGAGSDPGGNGGSTIIAGVATFNGGAGGGGAGDGGVGTGGIGGNAGGTSFVVPGENGKFGFIQSNVGVSGAGGSTALGFGGPPSSILAPTGSPGVGFGSGGSGGGASINLRPGGAGRQGAVIITEFLGA